MTLQLAEVRHLERRDRADNSRGTRKLARHDARCVNRRPKRSPSHLGPERNEQRVAGLRHSSGDNDDVRIQNIEQIGNSGAEVASGSRTISLATASPCCAALYTVSAVIESSFPPTIDGNNDAVSSRTNTSRARVAIAGPTRTPRDTRSCRTCSGDR